MSLQLFMVFFVSVFFISATPGPNMLLAFQYGLNYGFKRTLWTLAGLSVGLLILLLSTLLGIDVISREMPWLLEVVKVVGALYLIYLGVSAWYERGGDSGLGTPADVDAFDTDDYTPNNYDANGYAYAQAQGTNVHAKAMPSRGKLFRTGIWVSLSNPKAILFFAAFFPKFINFSAPLFPQYLLLTIGMFASETLWQMIYTVGGKQLAGWLNVGDRLLWLNRFCGGIFVLIAAALLAEVLLKVL